MRSYKIYQRSMRNGKKDITCGSDNRISTLSFIGSGKKFSNNNILTTLIEVVSESETDITFRISVNFCQRNMFEKIVKQLKPKTNKIKLEPPLN